MLLYKVFCWNLAYFRHKKLDRKKFIKTGRKLPNKEREMKKFMSIITILTIIATLIVTGGCGSKEEQPLTTDQQALAAKLIAMSPGDIVMIDDDNYFDYPIVIKEVWAKKNGDWVVSLRSVHSMMMDRIEIDELARVSSIDIIPLGSPEWTRVLMDFFVPEARTE